ncbi:MAG: hypothetical protein A3J93_05545 [Candidatus Magasanikbacteria bacterium RIFOXYC2_FULL_42_28]|uniref:HTH arsR-type domain-containing protein n=1 Tax=Candidatus Magasanikbacteria bacterium RIFOXYC2_FULL_42_28 TaxID=1798704 RepID=A0A1F6NVZ1_9BACT|nr:MAG: hypothetical protein A3J93_05545 [Candidatus Magasanikbacteria bacterium RIFOXYC2_FULL_42_28]
MEQHSPSKKIKSILADRKAYTTPHRQAIVNLLAQSKPMSAQDIISALKKADINRATVYRELKFLKELGLIEELQLPGRKKYYEIQKHHHHHLICTRCHTIKQLELPRLVCKLLADITYINNCTITNHNLEFSGLCNRCQKYL